MVGCVCCGWHAAHPCWHVLMGLLAPRVHQSCCGVVGVRVCLRPGLHTATLGNCMQMCSTMRVQQQGDGCLHPGVEPGCSLLT